MLARRQTLQRECVSPANVGSALLKRSRTSSTPGSFISSTMQAPTSSETVLCDWTPAPPACAAREAWALGPNRVWLHTCTLDSPRALPNYKARGFEAFRTETYTAQVDD